MSIRHPPPEPSPNCGVEIASCKTWSEPPSASGSPAPIANGTNFPSLLQNNTEMFDADGHRRKLIIFTEHRDTLNYLTERIRALLGRPEAVVVIHGGVGREDRRKAEEAFKHDKEVEILVATDAAGEGINLQRAHLMVNYDLPWNPNRLEQRFGRIHRIGQTEVCHLWNLVAKDTREGEVYHRLLEKLDEERSCLGGQVFDVLGQLTFDRSAAPRTAADAIRYGDQPEVKARLSSRRYRPSTATTCANSSRAGH